jgi:hypothetical protein
MSKNSKAHSKSNWGFPLLMACIVILLFALNTVGDVEEIKQHMSAAEGSEFLLYTMDETGNPPVPLTVFAIRSSPLALRSALGLIPEGTRITIANCEEYDVRVPFEGIEIMWSERGRILEKCRYQGLALRIHPAQ